MYLLTKAQTSSLQSWFVPEQPGPLVGSHVIQTGHGACWADRWPDPRALLAATGGNYTLRGACAALVPADLQPHVQGFLDADPSFVPLLQTAFPTLVQWPRVIFDPLTSPAALPPPSPRMDVTFRRLAAADAAALAALEPSSAWISKTWGGPAGLAHSGCAWGAFAGAPVIADRVADDTAGTAASAAGSRPTAAGGTLVAVACSFFQGYTYEDVGVVTVEAWRGQGLSTACAAALCRDIFRRHRQPTWSTSPDNHGSLQVACKLGFRTSREDVSYVIGVEIPQ